MRLELRNAERVGAGAHRIEGDLRVAEPFRHQDAGARGVAQRKSIPIHVRGEVLRILVVVVHLDHAEAGIEVRVREGRKHAADPLVEYLRCLVHERRREAPGADRERGRVDLRSERHQPRTVNGSLTDPEVAEGTRGIEIRHTVRRPHRQYVERVQGGNHPYERELFGVREQAQVVRQLMIRDQRDECLGVQRDHVAVGDDLAIGEVGESDHGEACLREPVACSPWHLILCRARLPVLVHDDGRRAVALRQSEREGERLRRAGLRLPIRVAIDEVTVGRPARGRPGALDDGSHGAAGGIGFRGGDGEGRRRRPVNVLANREQISRDVVHRAHGDAEHQRDVVGAQRRCRPLELAEQ